MKRPLKYIAILVVAILCLCRPAGAGAQINTDQMMRIGNNAMYFDDYILAIQYFNQVIQAKPYLTKPYLMRAIAKFSLEDFAGAERDADHAISINPYDPFAFQLRGSARHSLMHYADAIADYDVVLATYPDDENILLNKSRALLGNKDYAAADSLLGAVIDRHQRLDDAYFLRASTALMLGDTIRAQSYLDRGIELNPNEAQAYLMRFVISIDNPDGQQAALADLDRAIQLQPKNTDLYITRGNVRYGVDDFFGAIADFSYALQLDPGNDIALYNRAFLLIELMDYDRALVDLTQILDSDPENDLALYNRAAIYARKGDYRKAIDDISRFIDLYPQLATAYYIRSQWRLATGDKHNAKIDYDRASDLAGSHRPIKHYTRRQSKIEQKYAQQREQAADTTRISEDITPEEFERRLSSIIVIDNDADIASSEYRDYNNIRGRIQNHNFDIDIEPMMLLSFYGTPSELRRKTYYIKDLDDLNASRILKMPITLSSGQQPLDSAQVQNHFMEIEYLNSYLANHAPRTIDYIGRALNLMTLRNFESAMIDIDRAIELSPDYAVAYMLRAQARAYTTDETVSRTDNLRMQLADLDRAVELSPRNAVAWYNKGNVLFQLGDFTSAILAYTKAIEFQPDMGEAFFNRGYANLKLGNSTDGKADLSKAGELGIVPAYNLIKRIRQ